MVYKLNCLTTTSEGDEIMLLEAPVFQTKDEALEFIKNNQSFHAYNEFKDTLVLTVNGVVYHYVELVPVPEEL
jgi:hypothetical protein